MYTMHVHTYIHTYIHIYICISPENNAFYQMNRLNLCPLLFLAEESQYLVYYIYCNRYIE